MKFIKKGDNVNQNILKFYIQTNKLKNKLRSGYVDIGISKERLESIAEHVYGCLMLAIAIVSEYELDLDILKVFKMLALHELEETVIPDYNIRDNISEEEHIKQGLKAVEEITEGLINQEEIIALIKEFDYKQTKEAKFCYMIDKLEADFQIKLYDLENTLSWENAQEDLKYYGNKAAEIEAKAKTPSDYWILNDYDIFKNDSIFQSLVEDIRKIKEEDLC